MSRASEKLFDIVLFMPDSWHHYPPYYETKYGPGQAYEKLSQENKDILNLSSNNRRVIVIDAEVYDLYKDKIEEYFHVNKLDDLSYKSPLTDFYNFIMN